MESDLSRREFLERTALAAGLAGSTALPASTILAEQAQAAPGGRRAHEARQQHRAGGGVLDSQQAHAGDLADIEDVAERYRLPV